MQEKKGKRVRKKVKPSPWSTRSSLRLPDCSALSLPIQESASDRWLRCQLHRVLEHLSLPRLVRVAAQVDNRLSHSIITAHVLVRQSVEDWDIHQTSGQPTLSLIVRTINGIFDVLPAKPSDSIGSIKFKLSRKTRLPTECMMLFFAGTILGPSTLTLSAIGIVDQSVVYLLWDVRPYEHLRIFSHADGDFYPLLVHPEETVRDVKERIQTQDGILVELQQLAFFDLILDDDHQLSRYSTFMIELPAVFHLRVRACTA